MCLGLTRTSTGIVCVFHCKFTVWHHFLSKGIVNIKKVRNLLIVNFFFTNCWFYKSVVQSLHWVFQCYILSLWPHPFVWLHPIGDFLPIPSLLDRSPGSASSALSPSPVPTLWVMWRCWMVLLVPNLPHSFFSGSPSSTPSVL